MRERENTVILSKTRFPNAQIPQGGFSGMILHDSNFCLSKAFFTYTHPFSGIDSNFDKWYHRPGSCSTPNLDVTFCPFLFLTYYIQTNTASHLNYSVLQTNSHLFMPSNKQRGYDFCSSKGTCLIDPYTLLQPHLCHSCVYQLISRTTGLIQTSQTYRTHFGLSLHMRTFLPSSLGWIISHFSLFPDVISEPILKGTSLRVFVM